MKSGGMKYTDSAYQLIGLLMCPLSTYIIISTYTSFNICGSLVEYVLRVVVELNIFLHV